MSSTTERRRRQEGQVLVLFAGGLTTLLLFAALAYDGGMVLVERRAEQNAADAAALAGARYLAPPTDTAAARAAAFNVAGANGYTDAVNDEHVAVNIPPASGPNAGNSEFIEVVISSTKPSLFARVIGLLNWAISARAVATNGGGSGAPFSMMALDPTDCNALQVTGQGTVYSAGNIQVNSSCANSALKRSGQSYITVTDPNASCNVVGGIQNTGGGYLDCTQHTGALALDDPLAGLPAPVVPAYPLAPHQEGGGVMPIPSGCPGSLSPASAAAPATCQFDSSHAGTTWRLYPGYYPGGITLQGGTYYLEPGIYYIGGGGINFHGTGIDVISVAAGGTTLNYGIMFYNTEAEDGVIPTVDPATAGTDYVPVYDWCQDYYNAVNAGQTYTPPDPAFVPTVQCAQPIILNGASANIDLYPLKLPDSDVDSQFNGLVIYQDRRLNIPGDDVTINGSSSDIEVRGTIYVPYGNVKVNGNGGTVTLDQVIAYTFLINGNNGTINIENDQNFVFHLEHVGLVE